MSFAQSPKEVKGFIGWLSPARLRLEPAGCSIPASGNLEVAWSTTYIYIYIRIHVCVCVYVYIYINRGGHFWFGPPRFGGFGGKPAGKPQFGEGAPLKKSYPYIYRYIHIYNGIMIWRRELPSLGCFEERDANSCLSPVDSSSVYFQNRVPRTRASKGSRAVFSTLLHISTVFFVHDVNQHTLREHPIHPTFLLVIYNLEIHSP